MRGSKEFRNIEDIIRLNKRNFVQQVNQEEIMNHQKTTDAESVFLIFSFMTIVATVLGFIYLA